MFASILRGSRQLAASLFAAHVLKRGNPYRDAEGRYTTKENNYTGGKATELIQSASIGWTEDDILSHALPSLVDQQRYITAAREAKAAAKRDGTSKDRFHDPKNGGYTRDRLKVHHAIVQELLSDYERYRPEPGTAPTLILLGGRGGSGKSNFDRNGNAEVGVYDSRTSLVLDSDRIKEMLPGYQPDRAFEYHDESSDVFAKAVREARALGLNVVLDITMRSSPQKWLDKFKDYGYRTEAHYMVRPAEFAAQSAVERWNKPTEITRLGGVKERFDHGRLVPISVVLSNTENEMHFDRITSHVDAWSVWGNMDQRPGNIKKYGEGRREPAQKWDFATVLKHSRS